MEKALFNSLYFKYPTSINYRAHKAEVFLKSRLNYELIHLHVHFVYSNYFEFVQTDNGHTFFFYYKLSIIIESPLDIFSNFIYQTSLIT